MQKMILIDEKTTPSQNPKIYTIKIKIKFFSRLFLATESESGLRILLGPLFLAKSSSLFIQGLLEYLKYQK